MVIPKVKLLICSTILMFVIGCVPPLPTPTPIPPLDPNAVNIFIEQTAQVASTQTQMAMPTFTSTVTSTATPRNTYTPEPTLTPIQTFLFPTPTPVLKSQYYRVKHDNQLAIYNFKSRTFDGNSEGLLNQTPEIVPLFALPKESSGTVRTNVSGAWEIYIDMLNSNDQAKLNYLKSPGTALFNTAGFPQLESLTMGGNIVTLDRIQNGWGRVNTLDPGSPPNADTVNYFTRPDLVHKFVVVGWRRDSKTTIIVNPPKGSLYWPLVTKSSVWVSMDRLEKFPGLPMIITANKDLYIQPTPGPNIEQSKFQLATGESAKLIEYYPSGSNVWGRLQNGGWIPLLLYPQYLTSWTMETVPPPSW